MLTFQVKRVIAHPNKIDMNNKQNYVVNGQELIRAFLS